MSIPSRLKKAFDRISSARGRLLGSFLGYARPDCTEHELLVYDHFLSVVIPLLSPFDFTGLKKKVLGFVDTMSIGRQVFLYRYADSTSASNIYCSTYACMLKSLYGELPSLPERDRVEWLNYFKEFQSPTDGLFRDKAINNDLFEKEDWWGARHLAVQVICSMAALNGLPDHDFYFLEPFYSPQYARQWLESRNWREKVDFVGNEIMNHGCLLQYSRDTFKNRRAGEALIAIKQWLLDHLDPVSGMWGAGPFDTPDRLSKAVQGAYHILPLFFYDREDFPYKKPLLDNLLLTQNQLGGFGCMLNSSACEDIDTIEPLFRLIKITSYRANDVRTTLWKTLPWVLSNLNRDGGFVFRRNNEFLYGHKDMSSKCNESSLFATWFRSLSLAYLTSALEIKTGFHLNRCPGYEFD